MGISFVKNCGIIKLSVKKANCIDNTEVKGCNAMKEITKELICYNERTESEVDVNGKR